MSFSCGANCYWVLLFRGSFCFSVVYVYSVCIVSVSVMQNMLIKSLGRSQGFCSLGPFSVITRPPVSRPQDKGDRLADALQSSAPTEQLKECSGISSV